MVILTNAAGNEIKPAKYTKIDVDLNDTKDFALTIPASEWGEDYAYGNHIFIPDTEYGGIIGARKTSTENGTIALSGYGWRGVLAHKIIKPPDGEAYKIVTGELNTVLRGLICDCGLSALFSVSSDDTGVSVAGYQFDRYTTLYDGICKMLRSAGFRLDIEYVQRERGDPGYVKLAALQIEDRSEAIELSQDCRINFRFEEKKNGVNHLVCLGKGELTERVVVDLFVQEDGTIGPVQAFFDEDEVAEVYENTAAENEADLTEKGTQRLIEMTNKQKFDANVATMGIEVEIGDIIGGRDYITGMSMAKPVVNKIYTEDNGEITIEYKLEGDEQ